ncbi:MAG: undecaprenyldiphospho-muramoylpentapeptide beta-N-acetylglucosaminyltransferase [Paludibacteraceae bacterium]|nr:undecaprenyldiphospho-muramoylpentapeptide beta-N-acetylglucosaminyltransferase [Paludibacteraceae bacterium]
MDNEQKDSSTPRFLISGGGTGGHIFPAISIANALREIYPQCEILFIGALGRMEMERVPRAGYNIIGLPVRGLNRKNLFKNFSVIRDLFKSVKQAKKIIEEFRPNVAIGVGGYASGAAMKAAADMKIPVLLQEQNSFAGVTNKMLRRKASTICVAYEGMERFFPKEKLVLTGNPIRQSLANGDRIEAYKHYGFSPNLKTLLIIGGSLGARTINQSVIVHLDEISKSGIQVLWQTGKGYIDAAKRAAKKIENTNLIITDFVDHMELAYAMADAVISRAGASSISELCMLGKPSILVPSPNVAEDHQTHNAMALVNKEAAILVRDTDAEDQLINTALALLNNDAKMQFLSSNIKKLAQTDSAKRIAQEVCKLIR